VSFRGIGKLVIETLDKVIETMLYLQHQESETRDAIDQDRDGDQVARVTCLMGESAEVERTMDHLDYVRAYIVEEKVTP